MELQPRRMPPLKRLNGVGIDVALDLAGFIALTPDATLQFLERRGLAILVHPAEQHGDDLFGRKVRLPFGDAYLRPEEHPSVLLSLMSHSYAVFCLNKNTYKHGLSNASYPFTTLHQVCN